MFSGFLIVLFLVFIEAILSVDNAIVLAVLVSHLPPDQRKKALAYGIWGAIGFRFLSLTVLTYIMQSTWVKFAGAGYLLWMAGAHFFGPENEEDKTRSSSARHFWKTVLFIELMDIAFSADSILASVAVSDRFWVVFAGGALGIVTMRFVAMVFIRLIERFPNLERAAYFLIATIGSKLLAEGFGVDFHEGPFFLCFWGLMIGFIAGGFLTKQVKSTS